MIRSAGFITASPAPSLLGIAAAAGVDFVVLDAEQTGITVADCEVTVARLRPRGVWTGVRVPDLRADTLLAFANTGVDELVLPRVRRLSELAEARRATRFPPSGDRPRQVAAATAYGTDYTHEPRLSVLFETVEALDAVTDFAASPLFEGGWVGPTDLAAELEAAGRPETLDEAVQRIIDVIAEAGHSIGTPAPSAARAAEVFERGADRSALYWEREASSVLRTLVSTRDTA